MWYKLRNFMLILVCRHVATILPIAASLGHQRIFLWLLPGWLRLHTCSDVVSPSFDRMSSKHHVCPTLGWHRRINFPTRCTHGFATYEYTMYIYIYVYLHQGKSRSIHQKYGLKITTRWFPVYQAQTTHVGIMYTYANIYIMYTSILIRTYMRL